MTEFHFKRDTAGQRIYYPFGICGRGCILADDGEERKFKRVVKWTSTAFLLLCLILVNANVTIPVKIAVFFGLLVVHYAIMYLLVRKHPIAGERMKIGEAYQRSARGSGKGLLWAFFGLSAVVASQGMLAVFDGAGDLSEKLPLIGVVAFFGAGAIFFAWMARQTSRRD